MQPRAKNSIINELFTAFEKFDWEYIRASMSSSAIIPYKILASAFIDTYHSSQNFKEKFGLVQKTEKQYALYPCYGSHLNFFLNETDRSSEKLPAIKRSLSQVI